MVLELCWRLVELYLYFALMHFCVKLAYFLYNTWYCKKMIGDAMMSGGSFVFGDLFEMKDNLRRLHDWRLEKLRGHCNGSFKGTAALSRPLTAGNNLFVTTDPACVKHILKDNFDNWTKPGASSMLFMLIQKWLGNGIFTVQHGAAFEKDHAHWYYQRKVASHLFKRNNFRTNMQETFARKARIMIDKLDAAPPGEQIDMQANFFAFTMDSIMSIFYNNECDTLSGQENRYASAYDEVHRSFLNYLRGSLPLMSLLKILPWPFGSLTAVYPNSVSERVLRATNKHGSTFVKGLETIRETSTGLIDERRAQPDVTTGADLLSLFFSYKDEKGNGFNAAADTQEMTDIVLNFILAGRDTTACTLSWTFFMLSQNPAVQQKLFEEVEAALPHEDDVPTFDSLSPQKMPYLNGVIYESLRLHPPVPMNVKMNTKADVLPDGSKVPAGSWVAYNSWGMGRDPERYDKPQDMRPERWIPWKQPDPYEFPVFQAGPRVCLGKDMALFEAKLLTTMLIRCFRFEMDPAEAAKVTYSMMMTMSICNDKGCPADQPRSHHLWMLAKRRT